MTITAFRRSVRLVAAILISQIACSASAQTASHSYRPRAAIVKSGACYAQIADLYRQAGYAVTLLDEKGLAALQAPGTSALIIPPKSVFPASARRQLSKYLASGGTLVDLCPDALSYTRQALDPRPLVDFAAGGGYSLTRPESARITQVAMPGSRDKALGFSSRMVNDGDMSVKIPLDRVGGKDRDMICFRAKGDYNIDILRVAVEDTSGAIYVGFVELGRGWRGYAVPMADLVKVTQESDPQAIDPSNAKTLTLGISTLVAWKAATGSFAIGPVSLARSDKHAGISTSAVSRWRPQFSRAKAPFPEWIVDPFCDSVKLPPNTLVHPAGILTMPPGLLARAVPCRTIQAAPIFRGEWKHEVGDELKRIEMRRTPVLVAKGPDGRWKNVAEIRTLTDGPYRGSSMVLFGIDSTDYSTNSAFGKALIRATDYVTRTPRIVKLRPHTTRAAEEPTELLCIATLANPLDKPVSGNLSMELAGGKMKSARNVALRPNGLTEVEIRLGVVAKDFPMTKFGWSASLSTPQGKDTWSDSVDIKRSLVEAARYMMECQKAYRDGRFGEHFFTEIYAARALHAIGAAINDRKMTEASLRFCDMIVARQRPDGGLPLGYADNTGVIYTADGGTIVLGLLQIASWLDDTKRAQAYLDASRKYMDFREALYVTPEKSARLQEQFGKGATGTKAGLYGMGILKSDYIKRDRVPWPELKPEERGVPFVLMISMGAPAELYLLDQKPEYLAVVRRDAEELLTGSYPMSKSSHFGAECLFWMRQVLTDEPTRSALDAKIGQFMPFMLGGPDDAFYFQARGSLRLLSLAYYRRLISDSPRERALMVRSVWELCSESSSYSMASVAAHFPVVSYGPSEGGFRYVAHSSVALMEILQPGSTLLGPKRR